MAEVTLLEGIVKYFDDRRGYGFIVDTQDRDVFFHYTTIKTAGFKRCGAGEKVLYKLMPSEGDKLKAEQVFRTEAIGGKEEKRMRRPATPRRSAKSE